MPQQPWQEFRDRTGVPVVIDGAASFEALADRPKAHLGEIPVALSFHATKSFATAEGGAVVTTDCLLAEHVMQALNLGFCGSRDSRCANINGKMSEYHAAIGLAELDGWADKLAALRAVAEQYRRHFEATGLTNRFFGCPAIAGCYALFRCTDAAEATLVQESLERAEVDVRLWYGSGLQTQTYYAGLRRDDLCVTENLAPCLLALPVAPDLTEAAIARVVAALARGCRQ